jgi:deferrochelatase/peroxidase EfeB
MEGVLQNGIFHLPTPKIGNSCHIALIRAGVGSNVSEIGEVLIKLWMMFKNLEKGIVENLIGVNQRHLHPGNLTILIGYGPEIFLIKGVRKQKPLELAGEVFFKIPSPRGGGPIIQDSDIMYSRDIVKNDAESDQILLQFVGDNEFITSRAAFETWKFLSRFQNSHGNDTLYITRIFTGFQRDDRRNWFGFHDGVSNLPSKDRTQVISIARKDVVEKDFWTINGTYMAFLRTEFDVNEWGKISDANQSIIIGRDKITGCPLIGVDKKNQPIKDNRCPVWGTYEVIEEGNEIFREHPPFGKQRYLPLGFSDKVLEKSHVGTANPTDEALDRNNTYRIYRQGFEYLEPIETYPRFRVGLNFISFQKSPKRLFNILKYSSSKKQIHHSSELPSFETFFTVRTAGIFLVPPLVMNEPFPGAGIFLDEFSIANINKSKLQARFGQSYYNYK